MTAASTFLLPRLLGHSRASALLLTGRTVPASSPLLAGLYIDLLPARAAVLPAALALAHELAEHASVPAAAAAKALTPEAQLRRRALADMFARKAQELHAHA